MQRELYFRDSYFESPTASDGSGWEHSKSSFKKNYCTIDPVPPPENVSDRISVLDLGGTVQYWRRIGFQYFDSASFVLLNLEQVPVPEDLDNVTSVAGDATDLSQYADRQFDLVFSNSVIEHVGGFEAQKKMASEMLRTGKNFFLQTPNRYFFMEPHFIMPYFQFYPRWLRVLLLQHFRLGFVPRTQSKEEAQKVVDSVRLLTLRELRVLFPGAKIEKEKFLFMTKSYTLHN